MARLDPRERSSMIPSLNVYTSETSASSGSSSPSSSRTGAKASRSTARHSACTRASRSCSSGRFQASACSSNQIFWYGAILLEVGHRRPPLLEKRRVRRVQLPLPLDQPLGEALEHAHEQLLHRAEVVVDEAVVRPGLLGHPPRRDPGCADVDEQPLGRVEERLLGLVSWADYAS